ncbi:unnamed protein product [Spodoptera exigua]|nr:unnamed protein product [Spodoptera exigua]
MALLSASANELTDYLTVSNQRRSWTPATKELQALPTFKGLGIWRLRNWGGIGEGEGLDFRLRREDRLFLTKNPQFILLLKAEGALPYCACPPTLAEYKPYRASSVVMGSGSGCRPASTKPELMARSILCPSKCQQTIIERAQ